MIRRPGAILALLTGLNLLNYLDRLVVSAVLPKIQEELHLSNFEGGLLATIFLVGYFLTSPIFGALGDRLPRKGLIAGGVVVWSAATIASGFATGMWSLIAARAVVGIGEASYATLAPTIIDDVTTPERKGRALAIFYSATPIGAALGYIIGGQIEHVWGWRHAFFVAGGPGVLLALTCLVIVEPERKLAKEKPQILRDVSQLGRIPLYRQGVLGYCAYTAAVGAFSYWAPKFLYVRYGLPLNKANFLFGTITVVAGALGTIVGGRLADRAVKHLQVDGPAPTGPEAGYRDEAPTSEARQARIRETERQRVRALLRICGIGSALGVPAAFACFVAPSATIFFVCVFFTIVFLFLNTSPINAIVLQSVPQEIRGRAMALSIFAIHVLGDLWSPIVVGALADVFPIQLAMMTLPFAVLVSALVWWPRKVAPA